MTLDSKPLTRKYATGSKMRYRHNSSTPAQSCARGWLQQSLKTQEDDMCECIVHNENLYAWSFSGGKGNEFFWIDKIYERKSLSGHLYFDRKNLKTLTPFLHFCEIWGVWLQKTWASRTLARYLYNYPDKERWDWRKRVACPEQSRRAMREVWRPLKAVARTLIIYKLSSKGVKVLRWFC